MKAAIMQPSYIPWLGHFDLINQCDVFVFYDDVKYTKNDWRNRNRIKTPQGICWVTIPVPKDSVNFNINEVKVCETKWRDKHLKTLKMNYKSAPYYNEIIDLYQGCLQYSMLCEINEKFFIDVCKYMGIDRDIRRSSDIGFTEYTSTERLVYICDSLGADEYISSTGAKSYLDEGLFRQAGIKLSWQNYIHPTYNQLWGDFISHLSILDLLFNHGKESLKIISGR